MILDHLKKATQEVKSVQVYNMFAVYDKKAQAHFPPMYFIKVGEAVRRFQDDCGNPQFPFKAHLADYSLWRIGTFCANTAEVVGLEKPEFIVEASSFEPSVSK